MSIAPPTTVQPAAGLTTVPLFHAAWLFALGIALAGRLWLQPSIVLIALALIAAVCGLAALRGQRMAWLPLAALWLLLGAWCGEMEPHPAAAPALTALSDGLLRTVEGTVVGAGPVRTELEQNVGEPVATSPSERVDLRVASVEVVNDESDTQALVGGGVRLTVRWPAGRARRRSRVETACAPWFACFHRRLITIREFGAARISCWTRALPRRRRWQSIAWSGWGVRPAHSCRAV